MSFIGRILRPRSGPRKHNPIGSSAAGATAEALAADFLTRQGLHIIARNYRVRGGEIDLIAADGDTLVFVEVRLRRSQDHGGAAASITARKQGRIVLAARHWLSARQRHDAPCRFDCVLFAALDESQMEWIRDAFAAE